MPRNLKSRSALRAIMSRRSALALLAALIPAGHSFARDLGDDERIKANAPWAVYYGSAAAPDAFAAYGLVVLDPNYPFGLDDMKAAGSLTLGYVSLGEFNATSRFGGLLRDESMLVSENPNWPGSHVVDLRSRAWRRYVVEEVAPRILAQGFSGLFLDTLDSPLHLEATDPHRFSGMRDAAIALISDLRRAHGDIPIMMNRAYALLGDVNPIIDAVLAESLVTNYSFATRRCTMVDEAALASHLALLAPARAGRRPIPIFSLDYWDAGDRDGIAAIYARERALGHTPYVATILLDQIVAEPPHVV